MVSRNEGYRRGAGKEELSIAILRDFLEERVGRPGEPITGADENYRHGDLRFSPTVTIECKGQPIDPVRYKQNFVELFEVTRNERHAGGFAAVAGILGMRENALAAASVRTGATRAELGRPTHLSVSITSISTAAFTAYVNYQEGGKHIYVYERDEIMGHIRRAVAGDSMVRGAGNSNEDTFAVFVPLPAMRWSRTGGSWVANGPTKEAAARDLLSGVLNPRKG